LYYTAALDDFFHRFLKGRNDIVKIAIDGKSHTGSYLVSCECGMSWQGLGEQSGVSAYSPGLPIAESVVHMNLAHHGQLLLDLHFSEGYRQWLTRYWERMSRRAAGKAPSKPMHMQGAPFQ